MHHRSGMGGFRSERVTGLGLFDQPAMLEAREILAHRRLHHLGRAYMRREFRERHRALRRLCEVEQQFRRIYVWYALPDERTQLFREVRIRHSMFFVATS